MRLLNIVPIELKPRTFTAERATRGAIIAALAVMLVMMVPQLVR